MKALTITVAMILMVVALGLRSIADMIERKWDIVGAM